MANKYDQNDLKQAPVAVLMVPFPAQSHLQQLLQLSCLVSSYNIPVHYVGSSIHNRQVKVRARGLNSLTTNIRFHDFPIPHFPSPLPNPDAPNKFPAHLLPSFEAYLQLRQPVAALIQALSVKTDRLIVIHDSIMGSVVQDAASIPNAEIYAFQSISAFTSFFSIWEARGRPFQTQVEEVASRLPSFEGCLTLGMMNFIAFQAEFLKFRVADIHNTCRLIEGTYLDLLERINEDKHQWAIGPLNLVTTGEQGNSNSKDKCLDWLDKQKPNSVIYVSFGTMTSMADEQIKELALGIEESKVKFIWVLRDADTGDVFTDEARRAELPKGFEERTEGVGKVVREWAPQKEILAHQSTGGFMSHCGWNSCMESISAGVPIAAWPMHSDQPMNAVLLTEVLKIGLIVREWACREEIVTSSTIKESVSKLMASDEGEMMRKRAGELGEAVQQQATVEGRALPVELESFIAHITR